MLSHILSCISAPLPLALKSSMLVDHVSCLPVPSKCEFEEDWMWRGTVVPRVLFVFLLANGEVSLDRPFDLWEIHGVMLISIPEL